MQTDHYRASHTVVVRHDQCEVDVEALRRAVTQGRSTVDSMPDARRYVADHQYHIAAACVLSNELSVLVNCDRYSK